MKLKKNFVVYNMDDDYMLIPTNDKMASFGGAVVLNEVSAFLVNQMTEEHKTLEQLVAALLAEYNVDEKTAREDTIETINELKKVNVIDE